METSMIEKMYIFFLSAVLLAGFGLSILQIWSQKRSADFEIWYIELVIGSFYHAVRSTRGVINSWSPEVFYTKRWLVSIQHFESWHHTQLQKWGWKSFKNSSDVEQEY